MENLLFSGVQILKYIMVGIRLLACSVHVFGDKFLSKQSLDRRNIFPAMFMAYSVQIHDDKFWA